MYLFLTPIFNFGKRSTLFRERRNGMIEQIARPREYTVFFRRTDDASSPRSNISGFLMLQFLLARLLDGGVVTAVSGTGFTIVKRSETIVFEGPAYDIHLAFVLMKFCQCAFGKTANLFADGVGQTMAGLLSRVDMFFILIDEDHVAPFTLPREMQLLQMVVAVMACGNIYPDRIEELVRGSGDEIIAMAKGFVKKPFRHPTMEITSLRISS
jgi:hypothetical protein